MRGEMAEEVSVKRQILSIDQKKIIDPKESKGVQISYVISQLKDASKLCLLRLFWTKIGENFLLSINHYGKLDKIYLLHNSFRTTEDKFCLFISNSI